MSDKNIVINLGKFIADKYQNNPTMRILLPVVAAMTGAISGDPLAGAIASGSITGVAEGLSFLVSDIHQRRFNTLIDEFEKHETTLTEDVIRSEEFIHSVLVITRVALSTYQREKIRRFAYILLKAIEKDELASDKFETYVKLLNEITETELLLLNHLDKLEKDFQLKNNILVVDTHNTTEPVKNKSIFFTDDLYFSWTNNITRNIWDRFLQDISKWHNLSFREVLTFLRHLEFVGLYQRTKNRINGDDIYEIGTTTALYDNLAEWIKFEDETNSFLYKDEDTTSD